MILQVDLNNRDCCCTSHRTKGRNGKDFHARDFHIIRQLKTVVWLRRKTREVSKISVDNRALCQLLYIRV